MVKEIFKSIQYFYSPLNVNKTKYENRYVRIVHTSIFSINSPIQVLSTAEIEDGSWKSDNWPVGSGHADLNDFMAMTPLFS